MKRDAVGSMSLLYSICQRFGIVNRPMENVTEESSAQFQCRFTGKEPLFQKKKNIRVVE